MNDQAQSVYAAEDLWSAKEPLTQVRFGDWNEIWPFYHKLAAKCREHGHDIQPPKVRARKGALKAHYEPATQTVAIPPYDRGGSWALKQDTVLHEFAHHMSPGQGHGPAFRRAMLNLLTVLGWDDDLLRDCYAQVGLSETDKGDSITDKVSKLLTHAEGSSTEEERNTFLSKAESLAAQHSINLALVRKRAADADTSIRDRPITGKLFSLDALSNVTHRKLAVELGNSIGNAHGAKCSIRGRSQYMTFYGYPEDIELTHLMLARLTPIMFEEADAYVKTREFYRSGVAAVSARITFCHNFAWTVGQRLKKAVEQAQEDFGDKLDDAYDEGDVGSDITSIGMVIALNEKAVEVADYVAHEFKRQGVRGSWSGSRTSNPSWAASSAGQQAGQRANIYGMKELA